MPFSMPFRKGKQDAHGESKEVADSSSIGSVLPESTTKEAVQVPTDVNVVADEEEDVNEYPKAWKLAVIVIALCLSVFCMALDNTIIATAIPHITDQFHSVDDVGWYGSAYLLTTCAFQLLYGKIYSFYSIKWTFLAGFTIFEIGSAVCGAAPNSDALIIGRAIAGLGAAGIFSGAILIVAHTVPLQKRPMFTGFIGGMYGLASVAGPLMGGAFTDHVSWRWCFYINLPIGAVTALFIIFFFTSPTRKAQATLTWKEKLNQLDYFGTAVFVPAIVCLLLALQWGGSTYPWGNWRIILLFVMFGVLIIAFIAIQFWRQDYATVPPRILRQRSVGAAAFFAMCLGAAFFTMVYYIPIWFQAVLGTTATNSGIHNLPMLLGLIITSIVSGALVSTLGYYTPFMIGSSVLMAIGAGLLSTFKVDTGTGTWIGYQIVFGVGVGLGMQQSLIAVQAVLPLNDVPVGTAIIMFSQTLGGALFLSVGQNVFSNKILSNVAKFAPDVNPFLVFSTGATALADVIPAAALPAVKLAYNATIDQVFYVSVAMGALSIFGSAFMEWKSVKGKKIEAAGGA